MIAIVIKIYAVTLVHEKTFRDLGSGFDGLLAQLVERMTLNHHVVGSIPTQSTP